MAVTGSHIRRNHLHQHFTVPFRTWGTYLAISGMKICTRFRAPPRFCAATCLSTRAWTCLPIPRRRIGMTASFLTSVDLESHSHFTWWTLQYRKLESLISNKTGAWNSIVRQSDLSPFEGSLCCSMTSSKCSIANERFHRCPDLGTQPSVYTSRTKSWTSG